MPNRKNQHDVKRLLVAVQSKVTRTTARDDQLSHVVLGRTPDQRMILENLHRLRNQRDCFQRCSRLRFEKEISQPLKIN